MENIVIAIIVGVTVVAYATISRNKTNTLIKTYRDEDL